MSDTWLDVTDILYTTVSSSIFDVHKSSRLNWNWRVSRTSGKLMRFGLVSLWIKLELWPFVWKLSTTAGSLIWCRLFFNILQKIILVFVFLFWICIIIHAIIHAVNTVRVFAGKCFADHVILKPTGKILDESLHSVSISRHVGQYQGK